MGKQKPEMILDTEARALAEERERIRNRIGAIGGINKKKVDTAINIALLVTVATLFVLEIGFHLLPSMVSIEIAVFLVSIKVVMIMTSLQRISHYEFWILNTIDFRISQLESEMRKVSRVDNGSPPSSGE